MGPYKSYTSLINKINCPLSFPELIAFGRFILQLSTMFVFILFIHIANYHSLHSLSLIFCSHALSIFLASWIQRSKVSSSRKFLSWINHFKPSFNITIKQFSVWISTANKLLHTTTENVFYSHPVVKLKHTLSPLGSESCHTVYTQLCTNLKLYSNSKKKKVQ